MIMNEAPEREPRDTLISGPYKNYDFMTPLKLDLIGTEDDPCFGKHHDPRTEECSRCGDSELCLIACTQNSNKSRDEIESKREFKDLTTFDPREPVRDYIVKVVKKKKSVKYSKLLSVLYKKFYSNTDIGKKEFKSIIKSIINYDHRLDFYKDDESNTQITFIEDDTSTNR